MTVSIENNTEISNLLDATAPGMPVCNDLGVVLTGSLNSGQYNWWIVVLSYLIAAFAAYSALSLTQQVRQKDQNSAYIWRFGGALILGAGIWSMHFIGMLAYSMPMTVNYDLPLTLISLVIAVVAAAYALNHLGSNFENITHRVQTGFVMGAGISVMHYMGMAAMRMDAVIQYDKLLVVMSVVIAIVASFVALTLAQYFSRQAKKDKRSLKFLSSLIMGVAIAGMHYTGTAAATFYHTDKLVKSVLPIDSELLAFSIAIVMAMIIGLVILAASLQRSTSSRRRLTFLILTMSTVSILIALVIVNMLYRVSFKQQEERLLEMVNGQAHLISVIFNNAKKSEALIKVNDAFNRIDAIGLKGDLLLVTKKGSLVEIVNSRRYSKKIGQGIPFNLRVVEPMRRALFGENGTVVHDSYLNGKKTLSAFSTISKYKLALVASIEVEEIKSPYVNAMMISGAIGVLFILLGSGLFLGITNPIIRKLQSEISKRSTVEAELLKSKDQLEHRVKERTRLLSKAYDELDIALTETKEASRTKSDFLANMSHEIRTPMNGVMGMLHLLAESTLSKEQKDFVSTAEKSAENLLVLINDILDISKIEAGKLAFENADFNLREEVADVGALLAEHAHKKGLELAIDIAEEIPLMVKGDPTRLRQILINLTGNAIKFTSEGEVVIRIELIDETEEYNNLRITVKDTGIGITPEAQKHVFKVFSQEDSSTTRRFGGTGLGLSISRQLVELMGGEMGLASEQGKGSEFWFTVKLEVSQASIEGFIVRKSFQNIRVLIVDDNETNRLILEKQLTSWGIEHDSCICGKEALEKIKTENKNGNKYDLILLDMMMPEMNGLQVAQNLQNEKLAPKIILLSSSLDSSGREAADKGDIDVFMLKPARSSILYNTICTLLGETAAKVKSDDTSTEKEQTYTDAKVLVVEDNQINQKVILGRLNKVKIKADVANDGKEAIEFISKNNYDLVFMDCHMPVIDGYEATRLIRMNEKNDEHITIVAMTANAMEGDKEKCLAAGMDDYIGKPIKPVLLKECIQRWLREYQDTE